MIVADASVALTFALLAFLFWLGVVQPWHIFVVVFVASIGDATHASAMLASTSLMVPKSQLTRISGMNQSLVGIRNVVGPPLGALLVSIMPIQGILAIDVGAALIAILPLAVILIPQPKDSDGAEQQESMARTFVEGLEYLRHYKGLLYLFIYTAAIRVVAKPAWYFLPLLVTKHFGGEAIHLGTMSSVFGLGVITGGIILGAWGGFKKRIVTSWTGLILFGLSFTVLGFTPANAFWLAVVASALVGLTYSIYMGPIGAIIQSTVAPNRQGRMFAIYRSAQSAAMPIGLGIFGIFGDMMGIRMIFVVGGASILICSLMMAFTPSVMNIEGDEVKTSTRLT